MDRILVVDDERDIIHMIRDFMGIHDVEVIGAESGEEALKKLDDTIKLVVLDINMDRMNGLDVCRKIREKTFIPIVFLTAKATQTDKILGLGIGGDDYITKPFDPIELVFRVKAHIRRHDNYNHEYIRNTVEQQVIKFGNIVMYPENYRIEKNGNPVSLTVKEFELLSTLVKNSGIVLTRDQLLNLVWGNNLYDPNVVNTNIKRLRRKIEDNPDDPKYIKTIWGIGYAFDKICVKRLVD